VYDGTAFWFEGEDGKIHPIDPTSGSEGTAMVLTSGFTGIQGSAGGGFWAICNCGNDSDWQLRNVGGAKLDEFTFTSLGLTDQYSTTSGAFDGQFLWVNAYDYTTATYHLLKIDPTGSGSVVGNSSFANFYLTGMTFHEGKLWALYGGTPNRLVQLNPATMTVNDTVILPQGYFTGVGSDGTDVFLLGQDALGYQTIVEKLQGVP
jgi:hypothetical protein